MFRLELGEDDAGDDDDDAEDFEPAEGLLADEDGGDEREDGYGVVEDAGFGSSQDADTEVVECVSISETAIHDILFAEQQSRHQCKRDHHRSVDKTEKAADDLLRLIFGKCKYKNAHQQCQIKHYDQHQKL